MRSFAVSELLIGPLQPMAYAMVALYRCSAQNGYELNKTGSGGNLALSIHSDQAP